MLQVVDGVLPFSHRLVGRGTIDITAQFQNPGKVLLNFWDGTLLVPFARGRFQDRLNSRQAAVHGGHETAYAGQHVLPLLH
jgi:hypothetical protein